MFVVQSSFGVFAQCILLYWYISLDALNADQLSKPYYTESPFSFIRDYAEYYKLLDYFFHRHETAIPYAYRSSLKKVESIQDSYSVRNLSEFGISYQRIKCDRGPYNDSLLFYNATQFGLPQFEQPIIEFNNRYRFGNDFDDRFYSIDFNNDPWDLKKKEVSIQFIGFEINLPRGDYKCFFSSPRRVESDVTILPMNRHTAIPTISTKDVIMSCPVPYSLRRQLEASNERIITFSLQLHVPGATLRTTLLPNIRIERRHEMDYRTFNSTMVLMVDNLEDPMLTEYIIYYSLLGVDHFHVYDNGKTMQSQSLQRLRPFLDANIVTLEFYPYIHATPKEFNKVQRTTFNDWLQLHGSRSEWVGFIDADEFFAPSVDFQAVVMNSTLGGMQSEQERSGFRYFPAILNYLKHRSGTLPEQCPGVMFNTFESGCAGDPSNSYNSSYFMQSDGAGDGRYAVTLHCAETGRHIDEMSEGHGKMFLRTEVVKYLTSPHRYYHQFMNQQGFGVGSFRHFNGYRFSREISSMKRQFAPLLHNFTKILLGQIVIFDYYLYAQHEHV